MILHIIEKVAKEVFIPLTVGGGVRTIEDVRNLLNAGADKVSINTSAIVNPDIVYQTSSRFGSQCIVVAIDAKLTVQGDKSFGKYLPMEAEMLLGLMQLNGLRKWLH